MAGFVRANIRANKLAVWKLKTMKIIHSRNASQAREMPAVL